jgi:hypothetical protein
MNNKRVVYNPRSIEPLRVTIRDSSSDLNVTFVEVMTSALTNCLYVEAKRIHDLPMHFTCTLIMKLQTYLTTLVE